MLENEDSHEFEVFLPKIIAGIMTNENNFAPVRVISRLPNFFYAYIHASLQQEA
jgi:hypothetical protein